MQESDDATRYSPAVSHQTEPPKPGRSGMGRGLVSLGDGVYTVPEVCRILRPSMTSRRVHYWLDTGLLHEPLRHGERGVPTLLTFEQLVEIRTLQRLRDELRFSLQSVRRGLEALLRHLVSDEWHDLHFFRTGTGAIGVAPLRGAPIAILTGQVVMDEVLPDLDAFLRKVRGEWEHRQVAIEGFRHIISDAAVLAGAPIIAGTRVETAFVANLAGELSLPQMRTLFPSVQVEAIREAAIFEGAQFAA